MASDDAARIADLEAALRAVLTRIRPQGNPSWQVNTCLVTNEQVTSWWKVLGVTPTWEKAS